MSSSKTIILSLNQRLIYTIIYRIFIKRHFEMCLIYILLKYKYYGDHMKTYLSFLLVIIISMSCQSNSTSSTQGITIKNPWIKESPPVLKVISAYMTIENQGSLDDYLVSASSDACDKVELHLMTHKNDVMDMKMVSEIKIPTKGSTQLKPMGYHLMLINTKNHYKAGDKIKISLTFKRAGVKNIESLVKKDNSPGGHDHH